MHVQMLSVQFAPRDQSNIENLDRAAAYIRDRFREASARVSEQPFAVEGKIYRNVVGTLGPETDERIVVGAHYDAYHPYPGAGDNASGVAGLLELAALLAKVKLPLRVDLVAFTLEEPPYFHTPHMGSTVHAESLRQQGVALRAMFSLEMIGYFDDAPDSQSFPLPLMRLFYPSQGNFISVVGGVGDGLLARRIKRAMRSATPLPVYSVNAPGSVPGIDFSDHRSYWNAGYSAVMITDTAFYRNHNYHTVSDTADKLDYKRMAMVVQGVAAAVLAIAE
jgi:Zn-dependent M28 family amino/carboxypeptidase